MAHLRILTIGGILLSAFALFFFSSPAAAQFGYEAQSSNDDMLEGQRPPELDELQSLRPTSNPFSNDEDKKPQALDIRRSALKDAALSYGARGGLAMRSYEIRQELRLSTPYLDKTFDFSRLLVLAPSGLMIEPPIVSEALDALLIESDGQTAAVSDKILQINQNAKIVSAARNWRQYLSRTWEDVTPPPDLLRPQTPEERRLWVEWVTKGWEQGYEQADEIFQADLNRMTRDFEGMVRYRMLLSQNMITPPFALHEDRGVTGGGDQMRIGDRAMRITGPSQLQAKPDQWQPANR